MHLADHELTLIQTALSNRRLALKTERLNVGRDERRGAAIQTLLTSAARLENRVTTEIQARYTAGARRP